MDLTQFPEPLQKTFDDFFSALENVHHNHPEVVIKFLRMLILKYGLEAEVFKCKEYADGCMQTDDGDDPQEEKDRQAKEADPPPDVQEQQEQQVWNLNSLAEDVRAVAQETLNQNESQSFVYDDRSGNYYNYEQQCYYIPQHKLYYYVQNKAYYTYDEENHCMKFYSSSDQDSQNYSATDTTDGITNSGKTNSFSDVEGKASESDELSNQIIPTKPRKPPRPKDDEIEEGEIVDSDEEEEGEIRDDYPDDADYGNICVESPQAAQSATPSVIMASPTRIDLNVEPADHCAPCVRITVRKSKIKGLDVGQLFIITRSGGTLGRDGQHDILLPDSNVSKEHLTFHYKYTEGMDVYEIVDCSTNGTVLDGFSLEHNIPYRLDHGSVLKVGSTTLLCHIHSGTDTCTECEPSCLGFMNPASPPPPPPSGSLRTRHAAEMTQIKRKFGLKGSSLVPKLPKGYEDKSKIRRETVGSSHDSEKTDAGSTEEPIRSDNKGYAMLSKMGWKKGEGVGKSGEGTKAPVNVTVKMSKRGLGCPEDVAPLPKPKTKIKALEITKKRYEECE